MSDHLPPWARRSLSQPAGHIAEYGDPRIASRLAEAFRIANDAPGDTLTHGFHTWAARMHPGLARELIAMGHPDAVVLDPFMGGGTVLLEARVAGHKTVGVDLNPLAARIAEVRCDAPSAEARAVFMARAEALAERSEHRVRTRQQAVARLPATMVSLYAPHILKELTGLLEEIRKEEAVRSRDTFEAVFSSLVVKLSNKKADTSSDVVEKRLRKGLPTELFLRKCKELVQRWAELEVALGERPLPLPHLFTGDARALPAILEGRKVGTIVSSPPYGGTYDYQAQHALRLAWLGLDGEGFLHGEIGARSQPAADPVQRWNEELLAVLRAMRQVIDDDGRILLVIGDGELSRQVIGARDQVRELSRYADLELVAAASVERPAVGGGPAKEEHALALRPR